jgi:hypothetical protein
MFKSAFYELQPYRLHRWNRGDAMGGGAEAYFSVNDPLPAQADEVEGFHEPTVVGIKAAR